MTMLDQPAIGYDDGDIDTNVSTNGHINPHFPSKALISLS